MRPSAVLLVAVSTACFSDPPIVGDGTGSSSDASTGSMQTASSSATTDPMESGSGSGSGSAEASGEATTDTVAECGNGNTEDGEDCDDGNVSPSPAGQGNVVQMASCGEHGTDRALESLFGQLGGPGASDTWPTSIGGTCQQLYFAAQGDAIAIHGGPIEPGLPSFGDPGGQGPWALLCPPGQLPVGIRGRYYTPEPPYFRSLALMCAEATVDFDVAPPSVRLSMPEPSVATPSNGSGREMTVMCPIDTIAIGFLGEITAAPAINSIGPLCARIELVLP
jgi:hypothetical protein